MKASQLFKEFVKTPYRLYRSGRINKYVTKVLGPQYSVKLKRIEIDITYLCNLRCYNCNRSCRQSPTTEAMSVGQIEKFILESKQNNIKWEQISLLGGEPTLHPEFMEIVNLLRDYKESFSKNTNIQVVSNGYGAKVKKKLKNLPKDIELIESFKEPDDQPMFYSFNVAPKDLPEYNNVDYRNGCSILKNCGIGLSPYGYYSCAVAAGIDRIYGYNIGRKSLPDADDKMEDHLEKFCQLCGIFKHNARIAPDEEVFSKSWDDAYLNLKAIPVTVSKY
jgi:hypothetical protein